MHAQSLITFMAIASPMVAFAGAMAPPMARDTCMTPQGAMALDKLLQWGSEGTWTSLDPAINTSDACVTDDVATNLLSAMSELDTGSQSVARDVDSGLQKRIRTCPEVKSDAIKGVSKYSCSATKDKSACDTCATSATAVLVTACVACAAKANQESLPCCVAAASVFTTYYLKNCVHVF